MTVEESYTSLQKEEGRHLSYNMGEMLHLLLNWLGKHLHFHHYQQTIQCRELLWSLEAAGTARLCQAFPFPPELHGESPWSELIPKPCWGTNYLRSHWLVWAKTREGLFYLFTITDAEFLHLCPSVVNLLVSTMANEKEVYASQGVEFLNIAGVQDQKYFCFLSG